MRQKIRIVRLSALLALGISGGIVACSAGDQSTSGDQVTGGPLAVGSAAVPSTVTAPALAKVATAAAPKTILGFQRGGIGRVLGVAATGRTADDAAENFRQNGVPALGFDRDDLKPRRLKGGAAPLTAAPATNAGANGVGLMYDPATGKPRFRLYSYDQERDGVPVFRAGLRTLVREGGDNPVVWANADLRPMGSFRAQASAPARAVDLNRALLALRTSSAASGQPIPGALSNASTPTQTIFAGVDGQTAAPRLALQYTARAATGAGKWTFVADAETGDILHVESNVHFDVSGTVKGKVLTSGESAECGGVQGTAALPYANVTSTSGNAVADKLGAFTIRQTGTTAFNIVSNVSGKYFQVVDAGSSNSISLRVTPPGPANFLHQDSAVPPEKVLAQLTAYKGVNDLRDMLLASVPDYPEISTETNFRINLNVTDTQTCDRTGGAWYDGDSQPRSLTFCPRNSEHANTAFRSIIHHEYGHHIVQVAGSGQSEYGEGMADTVAMLFAKDPKIGLGYYVNQCSTPLRNANTTCQYDAANCSSCGGMYECGGMLSGIVWDIWKQLDLSEPSTSDAVIRELVFSSVLLHSGTKIDPSIAVDMLTLDDTDGLLENGTPHYSQICAGFAAHGMSCPAIANGLVVKGVDLAAEGLSAGPFAPTSTTLTLYNLGPQQNLAFSVAVPAASRWLTTNKTSGTIALGQSTTVTLTVDQAQAKLLADGKYIAPVQFVNTTSGVGTVSRDQKLRVGAPVPIFTATFNDGLQGFTVDGQPENLWHRSTACSDSLAGHSSPGSLYYGKDASCTYTTPIPVFHAINSPEITIANPQTAELGFKYFLTTENSSSADSAQVLLSVNGGAFKVVASNNAGGDYTLKEGKSWQDIRADISKLLPATGPTKIRVQFAFNAGGIYDNSFTGFAVDDLIVYAQAQTTGQGPCAGYCTNPISFNATNYQANNLGTAATCHQTTAPLRGGTCGNFASPRKLYVNGVAMTCNWTNWATIPPAKNGGYCVYTTSGNYSYAGFSTW